MPRTAKLTAIALAICHAVLATASVAKGPVVAYFTDDRAGTAAALAKMCISHGIIVSEQDDNHVVCSGEMHGISGALAQFAIGNSYSTTPQQVVHFSIVDSRRGYSIVQAASWIETQMAFGQIRREMIDGKKASQQLQDALLTAGGLVAPPALADVPPPAPQPNVTAAAAPSSTPDAKPAAQSTSAPALNAAQGRDTCINCKR